MKKLRCTLAPPASTCAAAPCGLFLPLLWRLGSVVVVLDGGFRCNWILGEDGEAHEFTPSDQETMVQTVIEPMASEGLRTICLAYKDYVKGKLFTLAS